MNNSRFLLTVLTGAAAFAATTSRADTAANIYTYAASAPVTFDGGAPANPYPVVSAVLTTPGSLDGYTYVNTAFFANDASQPNGIDIFYSAATQTANGFTYTPNVGDAITVTGTWSPFDGIPEIANSTTVQKIGVSLVAPGQPQNFSGGTFVTLGGGLGSGYAVTTTIPAINVAPNAAPGGSINSAGEGQLLTLDNVMINGGAGGTFATHANTTGTLTDQGGHSMTMFVWASSYAPAGSYGGTAIPTGLVDVTGIVDSFSGTDEFVPLLITAVPEPSSTSLLLSGIGSLAALRWYRLRKKA